LFRPTSRRSVCGAVREILLKRTADVRMELKAVELARYNSPYKPMKASANKVARAGNFIFVSTCAKYLENGSPPSRAKAQAIRPEAINWGGIAAITKRSAENDLCGDTCERGDEGTYKPLPE